jgi:hypothetical protein
VNQLLGLAVDQLGDVGGTATTGSWLLFGLLGLVLGAVAGSFLAHISGQDENKWSGRGALIGALLLMAACS